MQHPVGYLAAPDGTLQLADFWAFLLNPWALVQYAHTMMGAVVTGAFAVAAVGAFWTLRGLHPEQAALHLKTGIWCGLVASVLVAFPTGDQQGKRVARHQQPTLAAMEGRWRSGPYAELNLIGQPNVEARTLDNPVPLPGVLSFIAYGSFSSNVRGLDEFPRDQWPTNLELLYYSFHIMVGLGTLFIAIMGLSALLLVSGRLARARPAALGPDAGLPVPLHRQFGRLGGGRAGAPALAGVRHPAHRRRHLPPGPPGPDGVHQPGLLGAVLRAGAAVPVPGGA